MGFFGKLFKKKKKGSSRPEGGSGKAKKGKGREQQQKQQKVDDRALLQQHSGSPSKHGGASSGRKSKSPSSQQAGVPQLTAFPHNAPGRENQYSPRSFEGSGGKPTSPSQSDGRVLSPYNHATNGPSHAAPGGKANYLVASPQHDENRDHSNAVGQQSVSPRLSQHQLQQFDQQNASAAPMFSMSADIPRGQMVAMDDMNRSDASSSSFNLSTDAEDSEYENFRRRGVLPSRHHNSNALDSSVLSSPSAYTAESTLFPDLDDGTSRSRRQNQQNLLRPLQPSTPDDEPGQIYSNSPPKSSYHPQPQPPQQQHQLQPSPFGGPIVRMNHESEADLRAWTISPSSVSTRDHPTSGKSDPSSHQMFTFEPSTSGRTPSSYRGGPVDPPPSTSSRSGARNNFTSPRSHASSSTGFTPDPDFNFADFNAFGNNPFPSANNSEAWREEKKVPETSSSRSGSTRDYEKYGKYTSSPREPAASTSYAHSSSGQDSSLQDLLAQAKNKQRRSSRGGGGTARTSSRASTSSVNSAPAITASYLRQQHNLGRYSSGPGSYTPNNNDETSVSDIIQSLEATRTASQLRGGSRSGHRSVGDSGAVATARAVKERMREKRRKEREYGLKSRHSSDLSSSGESDHDGAAENWLFDEVTGALGPRGIAADLESLSGRSNRSKTSAGGRSHKSHRSKSRRNRASSGRRNNKSSGESVDSRGSRTSRYSHRSTKSYLSQMSEQSRSVANDLLRLEMQLAMVGSSQDNRDDIPARIGGGSVTGSTSVGGASRRRRKSLGQQRSSSSSKGILAPSPAGMQITRRTKKAVLAPPGKLGIILANKADSKGTVVSGVRTSSVLADKISPGDRIIAIDGEDVSRMTVSEITTIMGRKAEYERTLTVLTGGQPSPEKQQPLYSSSSSSKARVSASGLGTRTRSSGSDAFEASYAQYRR